MPRYIMHRLSEGVVTIWIVTLVVFALLRITGNPVDFLAPPDMPWTDRAYLREAYGLDKPLWQQYVLFNTMIRQKARNHPGTDVLVRPATRGGASWNEPGASSCGDAGPDAGLQEPGDSDRALNPHP